MAKALIPGGYMPMVEHGAIRVMICPGTQDASSMAAMPGTAHHDGEQSKPGHEMPCGFSGLTFTATSTADAVVLTLAIIFAMLLTARRVVPVPAARRASLRPPPRGPPIPV